MSLRTRLTLWYGVLLAVMLIGFSGLLYFTLERSLFNSVDESLAFRADQVRRRLLEPALGAFLQPEDLPPATLEPRLLDEFAAPGIYVQVLNARGAVIAAPANLAGGELPVVPLSLDGIRDGQQTRVTVPAGGTNVRVLTVPLRSAGQTAGALQVGQSLSPVEATMAHVARLLLTGGVAALVLAMVAGWLFTRRALRPVARVTETARHIAATGDYRRRLDVARPAGGHGDELFFLASTFNDMIARLEHMLESQRRLLADTSHELRNPLTVVRGNLALLRRDGVPDETRREAVAEADEEAARMGRLVNDLLLLARADAGEPPLLKREPVELNELVASVIDKARPGAGARTIDLGGESQVVVEGDRDRLKQVLANLVDNAIRATTNTGHIRARLHAAPYETPTMQQADPPARLSTVARSVDERRQVMVQVEDDGMGIAPEDLPFLFDRFYRANKARPRGDGGTGLGLAIAQYVAQAHGGKIVAESDGLGKGSRFTLWLPLTETPAVIAPDVAPAGKGRLGGRLRGRRSRAAFAHSAEVGGQPLLSPTPQDRRGERRSRDTAAT